MKHTLFSRALASLMFVAFVGHLPVWAAELGAELEAPPVGYSEGKPLYDDYQPAAVSPWWTGRLGYVQMWREYTSDVPIVVPDIGVIPRFTSSEFEFDSQPGADLSVSWDNGCGWGFDMRYLGVGAFTANEAFIPLDDPQIATRPPTDSLFDTGDLFLMDYTSEIQSFEVLGRRCLGRWDVSAGFRYMQLNESMLIDIIDNPGAIFFEEVGFAAGNDLYGFQVGLDGPLWDRGGRFRVDGFTKFGIYYNDVQAGAFLDDPLDPLVSGSGTGADSQTAFGFETGVFANYDVTCNLSARIGYQLLYLDGVALAADQVPNTGELFALPGTVPVNAHGGNSIIYHGMNVGLEYRY